MKTLRLSLPPSASLTPPSSEGGSGAFRFTGTAHRQKSSFYKFNIRKFFQTVNSILPARDEKKRLIRKKYTKSSAYSQKIYVSVIILFPNGAAYGQYRQDAPVHRLFQYRLHPYGSSFLLFCPDTA